MNKYRILEKEGKYVAKNEFCSNCSITKSEYVPRFIVQEFCEYIEARIIKTLDIKEFTSLDEARKFKRSLELKEGIVIE
jgi:hypothetical protein